MPLLTRILRALVVVVGLLVGITGLVMVLLGIGVLSPTVLTIPGINLNLQTATPGIIVMVIGFLVALVPMIMSMYVQMQVDLERVRQGQWDGTPYLSDLYAVEGEAVDLRDLSDINDLRDLTDLLRRKDAEESSPTPTPPSAYREDDAPTQPDA